MALKTKGELVEEILFEALGGLANQDSRIDERFVLRKINEMIAPIAKKNAFESNSIDGITYTDGSFYITYTDLAVNNDASAGLKYINLPAHPVGLPRNRAINVFPPLTFGGMNSTRFKAIGLHEKDSVLNLPKVPNTIFYFTLNSKIYFIQKGTNYMGKYPKMNLNVVSSGADDMDEVLSITAEAISEIKQVLVPAIRQMLAIPEDRTIDGVDIKE